MAFNLLLFATLLFLLAISHIDGLQEPGAAVSAQGLDLNVHSNIDEGVHLHLTADTLDPTALPTVFPTALPTVISTARPTAKKTGKPSRQPTKSIYMDNPSIMMSTTAKQAIVGTLTILLFVLMALEFLAPEVLFMIALIITMLCQILTIQETLSG